MKFRRLFHCCLVPTCGLVVLALLAGLLRADSQNAPPRRVKVLFLGDHGHHKPAERMAQAMLPLAEQGIDLTYTDDLSTLTAARLKYYDALLIYANQEKIGAEQEKALLEFVESGKGLVAVHCASYCFHNSPKYIELVGAQFKSHGTGVFKTRIARPDHPIMKGVPNFESWDETYVHDKHNADRVVLEDRVEGNHAEPWTWVRKHGRGRVFYTAWGHDHRTWSNPGFIKLLVQGVRWSAGRDLAEWKSPDEQFKYVEAKIPNYLAGEKWGTIGQPISKMQEPLTPQQSMEHLVVPGEFAVELFASEPDIVKPIAMTWDERGRLWVAETVDYPNEMQPRGQGRDRIKICEDTDGDGKADKFTIFADKLSIPTGLVLANGGLIVSQAPDMLFLKDTDGDDVADERRVLFTGFRTLDTHAGPSNLRYGFDNWIWATIGYSGFEGEVGGKRMRFGQGIFRFKPDGTALEFLGSTSNNTWGLGFNETGEVFASTANNEHAVYMALPNRVYESVLGWHGKGTVGIADHKKFHPITSKVRQMDWHGGFTAAAGHAIYTARAFPPRFWNRAAFVTEPTGHLVHMNILEPQGSHYVARDGFNLLAGGADEWISPIMAEVGPDGAVWVIDWYNFIIQHNPTPPGFQTGKGNAYVTPLRDKRHARIYRVIHRDSPSEPYRTPPTQSVADRIRLLSHDNLFWRLTGQRLMVEQGGADVAALSPALRDTRLDGIGSNPGAIHALWTMDGLGMFETSVVETIEPVKIALSHPAAPVRKVAAQLIERHPATLASAFHLKSIEDSDPFVRRQALLALSKLPEIEGAGTALLEAMKNPANAKDRWIGDAAVAAAARHDASFIQAVLHVSSQSRDQAATDIQTINLLANASFEQADGQPPTGWQARNWQSQATFELDGVGRTGGKSAVIISTGGADSTWSQTVAVQPGMQYQLRGWIRTEAVEPGTGLGALLNIHELQDPRVKTAAVTGTKDWTRVEVAFNSGRHERLTINCLFGGWGKSTGKAWFDDLELVAMPTASMGLGELVDRATRVVTTHMAQRGATESLFDVLAATARTHPTVAEALLDGLLQGRTAPQLTADQTAQLVAAFDVMKNTSIKARFALLMSRWGYRKEVEPLVRTTTESFGRELADVQATADSRIEAARWIVRLTDDVKAVLLQVTPQTPPELAARLMDCVIESPSQATGTTLLNEAWDGLTPASRRHAVSVLLRRPAWTLALLEQVKSGRLLKSDIPIEYWTQLTQHNDKRIAAMARELQAATTSADMQKLVDGFMPTATMKGDVAHGKELYVANCAVCHQFAGAGGKIGPALDGIGARPREELIVAILDPNRSVEDNFRLWVVTTQDGGVVSGRLETESQTTLALLDLAGVQHVVQRKDIKSISSSPVSLMPVGFERLGQQGLADLLEYLTRHE